MIEMKEVNLVNFLENFCNPPHLLGKFSSVLDERTEEKIREFLKKEFSKRNLTPDDKIVIGVCWVFRLLEEIDISSKRKERILFRIVSSLIGKAKMEAKQ